MPALNSPPAGSTPPRAAGTEPGPRRLLESYARLVWECATGRRPVAPVFRGFVRRRYVRRWLAAHPGRRFECRIPTGGTLLLEPDHWFIQHYYAGFSSFEPDVQMALKRMLKPGGTFIDCGANAGFFSVMANDVMAGTGSVVAVEANPELLPQLNANLEENGIARRAIHAAVASHGGVADFFVPARVDEVGGLRPTAVVTNAEVSRFTVPASTLDDLVGRLALERVDMIKIDIEGGEIDALRSARTTIAKHRPVLVVEYSCVNWAQFGATPRDLMALCDEWRYRICRYDVARDAPLAVEASFWDSAYTNMVLLPQESR